MQLARISLVLSFTWFLALGLAGCGGGSNTETDAAVSVDAGPSTDAGPVENCGDGVLQGAEACDDNNNDADDGCSDTCTIEDGFACAGAPSVCAAVCGDGLLAGMEACDDGDTSDDNGCSATCTVEPGYACAGTPSVCTAVCGDGIVAGPETCDDGDTESLDGCSETCTIEIGVDCTGAPSVCTAVCGDGVVATIEACDTGATGIDDGCSDACTIELGWSCAGEPSVCITGCGDSIIAGTEECDDGDMVDGDGCSMGCAIESGFSCSGVPSACDTICGDSIIAGSETCDTGATGTVDGCSDACATETGYICTGEPSICTTTCGDGIIAVVESCDDGNFAQGDGCDHFCATEFGFGCTGSPSTCSLTTTVAQVALGGFGGCLRTATGMVGCFGDNTEGEVGNDTLGKETFLPAATGIADAAVVVAGDEHHCAIRTGGTVWCWGDNSQLQQGVGTPGNDQPVPQQIVGLTGVLALDAGDHHNCAVLANGTVVCWGDNDNRQLGRGGSLTVDSATPELVTIPAGRTATALALGADHSCVLLDDKTVACWGDDDNGQLGDGVAGTDSGDAVLIPGLTKVVQLAAGGDGTCARTEANEIVCWGDNIDGQVGDGTKINRPSPTMVTLAAPALDITVGTDFVCALLNSGAVYCWGESTDYETGAGDIVDQPSPVLVRGLNGITPIDVEAGARGACVLTGAGDRLCWGHSEEGQLGIAPLNQLALAAPIAYAGGTPTELALSRPEYRGQSCAVFADTSVECNGAGDTVSAAVAMAAMGIFAGFSEHLAWPTVIAAFAGALQAELGDGFACTRTAMAVLCVGDNAQLQLGQGGLSTVDSAVPVAVTGLTTVDEVAVGAQFACARTGGNVQCWGDNDNFQAGEGSVRTDQSSPVTLAGLSDAVDVELGENHGCVLRTGGLVSCWGDDVAGQLGRGVAGTDDATPAPVVGLPTTPATQLVVGQDHACVLAGAEVWCWGENGRGQLGQGTTADSATPLLVLDDTVAIAAGYNYVCALRTAGTVTCWGYGLDGQLGNGGGDVTGTTDFTSPVDWVGASGVTAIEAGNSHTCLRTAAGWQCAGFRSSGQLGDGTTLEPTRATPVMAL